MHETRPLCTAAARVADIKDKRIYHSRVDDHDVHEHYRFKAFYELIKTFFSARQSQTIPFCADLISADFAFQSVVTNSMPLPAVPCARRNSPLVIPCSTYDTVVYGSTVQYCVAIAASHASNEGLRHTGTPHVTSPHAPCAHNTHNM